MDTTLCWITVGIGVAAALSAVVAGRRQNAPREGGAGQWTVAAAAALGVIVVYLLTRPESPPFAIGQRLGYGALIGGLCGILAGLWSLRAKASLWASGVAEAGLSSLCLIGVGVTLLIFPGYPQPALAGFMIGSIIASALFRLTMPAATEMEAWCLSSIILAAAVLLAVFRFEATTERFWWRTPLLIFAAAIVGQIIGTATAREGRSFALPATVASVITLALSAVFAWRLFPDWSLLWVAGAGVVTFVVIAWLAAAAPHSPRSAAAGALAVVAFATFGFRLMGGFGIGVGLLAGWAVLLPALAAARRTQSDEDPARILTYAAFIGAGVLLFRLFLENYSNSVGVLDLKTHNTVFALALGAVFPFVLTSFFPIPARCGMGRRLFGAGGAGILSAALPLLVLVIWGFKPTLGFLAGCIAAEIFLLFAYAATTKIDAQGYPESALLVLTAQVSAVLLSGLLAPVIETTRATKSIILAAVVVVGVILTVVFGLIARAAPREE